MAPAQWRTGVDRYQPAIYFLPAPATLMTRSPFPSSSIRRRSRPSSRHLTTCLLITSWRPFSASVRRTMRYPCEGGSREINDARARSIYSVARPNDSAQFASTLGILHLTRYFGFQFAGMETILHEPGSGSSSFTAFYSSFCIHACFLFSSLVEREGAKESERGI